MRIMFKHISVVGLGSRLTTNRDRDGCISCFVCGVMGGGGGLSHRWGGGRRDGEGMDEGVLSFVRQFVDFLP